MCKWWLGAPCHHSLHVILNIKLPQMSVCTQRGIWTPEFSLIASLPCFLLWKIACRAPSKHQIRAPNPCPVLAIPPQPPRSIPKHVCGAPSTDLAQGEVSVSAGSVPLLDFGSFSKDPPFPHVAGKQVAPCAANALSSVERCWESIWASLFNS